MASIKFKALKVSQPIGEFFVGVINARDLVKITFSDIRRLEERDVEKYLGIQRPLQESRVKKLKTYVGFVDATFPTSVVLSVSGDNARWIEDTSELELFTDDGEGELKNIAKIIDGQHRIAAFDNELQNYEFDFDGDGNKPFEINVSIFIDIDLAEQANIFSTVNLNQTKVNRSLVYDLEALAEARSPQKTCHTIAVALNNNEKSPLYRRIKRLGVATDGIFTETITQASFVQQLQKYISPNPNEDRNRLLLNYKKLLGKKELDYQSPSDFEKYIFRELFINKNDNQIASILWNYFSAVRNRWPAAWDSRNKGDILNKTNGFVALMRFLKDAYKSIVAEKGLRLGAEVSTDDFSELLSKISLDDSHFTTATYKPGSSGSSDLYKNLMAEAGL